MSLKLLVPCMVLVLPVAGFESDRPIVRRAAVSARGEIRNRRAVSGTVVPDGQRQITKQSTPEGSAAALGLLEVRNDHASKQIEEKRPAKQKPKAMDASTMKKQRPMCGRVTSKELGRWEGNVSADGKLGVRMTYDLESCQLRRYTSKMARRCLQGKHLVMVGDSVTRYQYLSLVHMLVKGSYPDPGIPTAQNSESETHNPSVCQENDYRNLSEDFLEENDLTRNDLGWPAFYRYTSRLFGERERCDCFRRGDHVEASQSVENRFYNDQDLNLSVSFFSKLQTKTPIRGHYPNGMGEPPPALLTRESFERIGQTPFAWQADNIDFINHILPKLERDLGQVHAVMWNQGLWGHEPDLANFVKRTRAFFTTRKARAMWKSTTHPGAASKDQMLKAERLRDAEFSATEANGWDGFDATYILKNLTLVHTGSEFGVHVYPRYSDKGQFSTFGSGSLEVNAVHWDNVHYRPWVYEELNNVWLNMLCNVNA